MKNLLSYSLVAFLLFVTTINAQNTYNIAGQEYTLKAEVEGALTLLWNTIDGEYRYFSKKGDEIAELKNTKVDGKYQEEYKHVLLSQTQDESLSVKKLHLTTTSLKAFFNEYNKLKDPSFESDFKPLKLKLRLGAFAGITNNVYVVNPNNESLPLFGIDFEIIDNNKLIRHALVLQFKQTLESDSFKYSASDFSFNYRFKFVKTEKIDVFINMKFASYSSVSALFYDEDGNPVNEEGDPISEGENPAKDDSTDFQFHLNFGLGADYALGNGYLTFTYNDIVSATQETNGEFPLEFTLGYKFNL